MPGGAPYGNTNASTGARWREAVIRALQRRSKAKGIEELDRLADKFLDEVEASSILGYRELADRLDGKAHQTIGGIDGEAIPVKAEVTYVRPDSQG